MAKSRTAPALSNETVQERLTTGVGSKGGTRGSLTRCATKFGALCAKLQQQQQAGAADADPDPESSIDALKDELKREVRLFQVEMKKWLIMIQSSQKELIDAKQQEEQSAKLVQEKQEQIQQLRTKAAKVARTRKCWQEYETLAKLARQRSPRRVLQSKMEKMNSDLVKTKKQLYETAAESKVREKQFHLLIQCMLDLKRSLGEVVEIPPMKKETDEEEDDEDDDAEEKEANEKDATESEKKIQAKDDVEPMETEKVEEEDDDGLYGGL